MQKRSCLPDVPVLELPVIFDETPSFWMRNLKLPTSKTVPSETGDAELPLLDGVCTASAYNTWFEELHGLRHPNKDLPAHTGGAPTNSATNQRHTPGNMEATRCTQKKRKPGNSYCVASNS